MEVWIGCLRSFDIEHVVYQVSLVLCKSGESEEFFVGIHEY
jgi:hypothetical protein